MTFLLNSPVLTAYGTWKFAPLDLEVARKLVTEPFHSAIGHEGASQFLSTLLEIAVPVNRSPIEMAVGDRAVVLRLRGRLPEMRVLTAEQMSALPFELGLLERLE